MPPLHGLRLNCLLAPISVASIAMFGLLLAWSWHAQATRAGDIAGRRMAIAGLARLIERGGSVELDAWLAAHHGWRGLARLTFDGEQAACVARTGTVPDLRELTPSMLLAFDSAQAWDDADGWAVAAPCLPTTDRPSIVVGWYEPAPEGAAGPWLLLIVGVLSVGGGLGLYLVARVYRPVAWMEQATLAAASGRAEPPGGAASPETASLRSSLALLLASRSAAADDHA